MAAEAPRGSVQSAHRVFDLTALLTELLAMGLVDAARAQDVLVREAQLRAKVLRSLAEASRTTVVAGPIDIVAAAEIPWPGHPGRVVDDEAIVEAVAPRLGLEHRRIDPLKLDTALVTKFCSAPFAMRHAVLPLEWRGASLAVAFANPFDRDLAAEMQRIVGAPITAVLAARRPLLRALEHTFGFSKSVAAATAAGEASALANFEQLVALSANAREVSADERPVVAAVDYLLRYAFDQRASDIHLEPKRDAAIVRLRIDGVLHPVHTVPRAAAVPMTSRLKMLARMDIAEKRKPQDGRIKTKRGASEVELRVSTVPTAFGEKLVMRVFDPEVAVQTLGELGFPDRDLRTMERWIAEPHGLVLVTGPTGSGKTTTLYAALRAIAQPGVNVTTIEDPIEVVHEAFNQIQVQPKIDLDFAEALRHVLRQDPDVIMVGEIRDRETAIAAVQAALTGHLVFATVHTNSAAEAVTRLLDLGVERYLLSGSLLGVLAQRLVRGICAYCSEADAPAADKLALLGLAPGPGFRRGRGCERCRQTGYQGRGSIVEMLTMTVGVREALERGEPASALERIARGEGLRLLRECGAEKAAAGQTTIEEVLRVTSSR
jgi:general secretion pathway protein E